MVSNLALVGGDPVGGLVPVVALDILHSILQVAEALGQVDLQQVPQQVFQVSSEVGGEAYLKKKQKKQGIIK